LRSRSILRPGVVLERRIRFGQSQVIEVVDQIRNTSRKSYDLLLDHPWNMSVDSRFELVVPTSTGVLKDSANAAGRTLNSLQLSDGAEEWPEGWMCCETNDGHVAGVVWRAAERVHAHSNWGSLHLKVGRLKPGESRTIDPVLYYAGEGSWRSVQGLWKLMSGMDSPITPESESPRRPVSLVLSPDPVLIGSGPASALLHLQSAGEKLLEGQVQVETTGCVIGPSAPFPVTKLKGGHPFERSMGLTRKRGTNGGAASLSMSFRTGEAVYQSSAAAWVVAPGGKPVKVAKDDGLMIVDNGLLSMVVASGYCGSVVSLKRGKREYLNSSYPNPGMRGWINPWHGGIEPRYSRMWGRLYKERFRARFVERTGCQGVRWRGVDLSCRICDEAARGQSIGLTYLLAPGLDVMAILVRVKDVLGLRSYGDAGITIDPSFADGPETGSFYNREAEEVLATIPPYALDSGRWTWGGIESGNGQSLYLSSNVAATRAGGESDGPSGGRLWGNVEGPLKAGETLRGLFFVVPAEGTDCRTTHAVWSAFDRLP